MPLYKGNTNISAIYKGTTPISAIYKGTKLVYSSAFWQSLFYSYLYNDLIPTTIDNKNVLDKAKVSKIYANGVIENQLVPDTQIFGNSANVNVSFNSTTHEYTFETSTNDWRNPDYNENVVNSINGHKYLLVLNITSKSANANIRLRFPLVATETSIIAPTTDLTRFDVQIMSTDGNSATATFVVNYIDLTLRYGTGNEPTTLTDKRIQAILNRVPISYNAGTYKGTSISNFSSKDSNNFALDTLSFIYQGNGNDTTHDIYELTKTSHIFTKNVDYVNETTMPTTRSTPQVITIPKKRLGIVDLGSIAWYVQNSSEGKFGSVGLRDLIKPSTNMIYCAKLIFGNPYANVKECIFVEGNGAIDLQSDSFIGKTNTEVKALLSGQYLFYETNADVSDINDTIAIEAGGSITSDSEVLPDVEFSVKCK